MHTEFQIRSFIGTFDEDWQDPGLHRHATFEISILLEGRGVFGWDQGKHDLEAGHVVLIPSHIPHLFEGLGKNRYGVIHLEGIPTRIQELLQMLVSEEKPTLFALSRLDKDRFERLFREWQRIKSSQLKEQTRNYVSWIEVMVLFLLEHSQKDQQSLTITKAADYIRENLQEGVQISGMAALAGFSEAGFRRLFEQIYHMSPKKYQQQCRMTEAKWLLSSSDKEIMEIAAQIGFTRLHSFSQWFKSAEGVSPTEWRKMQQLG
ncbi:helix-turn-helix domain-containing protein [Paenibacillus mendelii]|uniref:Helix-turn-helix domain-containing protein n=1 Tax=Paenibacillus mendelii TaxID=206163 RepID=A0ABV6JL62_9BACL|nr:AraC family transcriptional regulator [Paenibacillus mendelii]MCQ6563066.1 AraC family transcriptional regulator [Paenibacillus mendelii]